MSKSLQELQIGTYANIAMVRTTTPVYVALGIFVQHRVSALPVVDEKGERPAKKTERPGSGHSPRSPAWKGIPWGGRALLAAFCSVLLSFLCFPRACGGHLLQV